MGANINVANTFMERLKGLMFDKEMKGMDGLLINNCNSIHTFFMNYSIDALFLDSNNKIVKIIKNLAPWRITGIYFKANKVLEIKGGQTPPEIRVGDTMELIDV